MKRRTKIVCTLGPAVDSREKIRDLIQAGMNVARLNCSHGDWESKRRWVEWIRELSPEMAPVAILADLQGPKFRIGDLVGGALQFATGDTLTLGVGDVQVPIEQPDILAALKPGVRMLLGDGEIELKVTGGSGERFEAKAITGGLLKSRKGVTLVNKVFNTPALTPKDLEDVQEALRLEVDFLALSYVKDSADVRELRRVVDRLDSKVHICAKIETNEAVQDLGNILRVADAIMVARGDMGLQMDIDEVPLLQKKIIDMCNWAGKPVITATQMLESMIVNPRPTRAEATDVANAVLDGTDALMLSGETAAGAFPIECVKTMCRIAEKAEPHFDRTRLESKFAQHAREGINHTDAIAHSVSSLSGLVRPAAIITTTTSGQTARHVSKFRPKTRILCATWDERVQRQMAMVWGVEALITPLPHNTDEIVDSAIDAFLRHKRLNCGETVIVTAGVPAGLAGNTNLILIQAVK